MNAENVDAEMKAWTAERDDWMARNPLIQARFEAARNNNRRALEYRGTLSKSKAELTIGRQTYKIIARGAGAVEYVSNAPSYALGWAGDIAGALPARAIAFFRGEQLLAYAMPNIPRPDISTDPASLLSFSGFYLPMRFMTTAPPPNFNMRRELPASELLLRSLLRQNLKEELRFPGAKDSSAYCSASCTGKPNEIPTR
jgi:hypothetical protein